MEATFLFLVRFTTRLRNLSNILALIISTNSNLLTAVHLDLGSIRHPSIDIDIMRSLSDENLQGVKILAVSFLFLGNSNSCRWSSDLGHGSSRKHHFAERPRDSDRVGACLHFPVGCSLDFQSLNCIKLLSIAFMGLLTACSFSASP